eukprot:UN07054
MMSILLKTMDIIISLKILKIIKISIKPQISLPNHSIHYLHHQHMQIIFHLIYPVYENVILTHYLLLIITEIFSLVIFDLNKAQHWLRQQVTQTALQQGYITAILTPFINLIDQSYINY